MTRDFNKQRRDDMRPSSREQSSNRYGNERSPRPARPRLHRESVDRAWESGAPSRHADYRTRGSNDNKRQVPRNTWRDKQQNDEFGQNRDGGRYPARNTRPSYPSYGDRSGDRSARPRRFDNADTGSRDSHTYQRPSSRSFNDERTDRRDRPYRQSRPYGNNRYGSDSRGGESGPAYREQPRPYDSRPSYRSNEQDNGFQRRNKDYRERNERGPRQFDRPYRREASDYNGRPARNFDRDRNDRRDRRGPENDFRNTRSPRERDSYDARNPRWQSRPFVQREGYHREQNDNEFQAGHEQYEGDYEQFSTGEDKPQNTRRPAQRFEKTKPRRAQRKEQEPDVHERHVTQLPDGRVLKGPRPVQRKNAQFWTDIAQNTDTLLEGVQDAPADEEREAGEESTVAQELSAHDYPDQNSDAATQEATSPAKAKPRNRATSAAARSKIATKKRQKMNGALPRPSKRGYKWPTS